MDTSDVEANWEQVRKLCEKLGKKYKKLDAGLSELSTLYADPPLAREPCERLDAAVQRAKQLAPLGAAEYDRLRDEQIAEWREAARVTLYEDMIDVAYKFNTVRNGLFAVITELDGAG